jgi:hypothetical protein
MGAENARAHDSDAGPPAKNGGPNAADTGAAAQDAGPGTEDAGSQAQNAGPGAQGSGSGGAPGAATTTEAPPPYGLDRRRHLRADDYARKKQGGYFTGLPLFNYDPNTAFGFGGRVYYYYDGHRSDPLFAYTPYLHRIILQGFATTAGAQDQLLDYDAPWFLGSPYRLRATLEYEAALDWPYYGIGSRSMAPLSFPGAPGVTFAHASDYERATHALQPNGLTYGLYNLFGFQRPILQLGLEQNLLGGILRALVGANFSYVVLTDYTSHSTNATGSNGSSVQAPEATTMLAADCAAGRILGCGGGWDNVLRLALSLDTRDFEPDPNSGVYTELSSEFGTAGLGSQYQYMRVMLSVRGFYSPIPKITDLVVAVRGLYEIQTHGTPFFSQELLPFIDDNHAGLGGLRTLRGYKQNRFVGPIIALTNYELRWTFVHVHPVRQDLGLMVVPFLDIGRVFDSVGQTTLANWKRSQGAGFRIAWNEATIIMVDYGFSDEDTGLYINFNHIF